METKEIGSASEAKVVQNKRSDERRQAQIVPEVEIKKVESDSVDIVFRNTDLSLVNAVRRIMQVEIPTMAIDIIQIEENQSILHDRALGDRLALIPLSNGLTGHLFPDALKCPNPHCVGGFRCCHQCSVSFKLHVVNTTEQILHVTSEHLKPVARNPHQMGIVPIPDEPILLTKLAPREELKLMAYARRGLGRRHAKWIPCAPPKLSTLVSIQVDTQKNRQLKRQQAQQLVDCCPAKVFALDSKSAKEDMVDIEELVGIRVQQPEKCIKCRSCLRYVRELDMTGLIRLDESTGEEVGPIRLGMESPTTMPRIPLLQLLSMALETLFRKLPLLPSNYPAWKPLLLPPALDPRPLLPLLQQQLQQQQLQQQQAVSTNLGAPGSFMPLLPLSFGQPFNFLLPHGQQQQPVLYSLSTDEFASAFSLSTNDFASSEEPAMPVEPVEDSYVPGFRPSSPSYSSGSPPPWEPNNETEPAMPVEDSYVPGFRPSSPSYSSETDQKMETENGPNIRPGSPSYSSWSPPPSEPNNESEPATKKIRVTPESM